MVATTVSQMSIEGPIPVAQIWSWLSEVADPEIPVISVVDLGIVRDVTWSLAGGEPDLTVTVTPTYSGCPATEVIAQSIREALTGHGIPRVTLKQQLSPPWTTDWLSATGKEKLRIYGIAPPQCGAPEHLVDISRLLNRPKPPAIICPNCGSNHTSTVSNFSSTPCKALYRCNNCAEPFDYFKPH